MWRRRPPPEPGISRDEVLEIFEALADIKALALAILDILDPGDELEEDDA
jgi:hypothetical protein